MKCSISNIASVISESIPNPAESGFDIFVGLEHYDSGEVKVTRCGSTQNLVTAVKVFRKGDILLARRNVYLKRAGLVDFDGVTSGDSIVLRVKDDLSSLSLQSEDIRMYLPFVLNTEEFWNYAEKYSDGTMSKRLSPKTLLQYEFDIPDDVTEKNRLLWQAYMTKESYKAMITATDEMVKSQFIEMFGEASNWDQKPWAEVFDTQLGKMLDQKKQKAEEQRLRYLANINVQWGCFELNNLNVMTFSEKDVKRFALRKGDLIICEGGVAGRCAVWQIENSEIKYQKALHRARPKISIDTEFVRYYLQFYKESGKLANYITKGTIEHLTGEKLATIPVILPPFELQEMFVSISRQADKSKFELKQAIEKIDKVMRALMQ